MALSCLRLSLSLSRGFRITAWSAAQAITTKTEGPLGKKINDEMSKMDSSGTLKRERVLTSAQGPWISAL
jgi:hypothetical protein